MVELDELDESAFVVEEDNCRKLNRVRLSLGSGCETESRCLVRDAGSGLVIYNNKMSNGSA